MAPELFALSLRLLGATAGFVLVGHLLNGQALDTSRYVPPLLGAGFPGQCPFGANILICHGTALRTCRSDCSERLSPCPGPHFLCSTACHLRTPTCQSPVGMLRCHRLDTLLPCMGQPLLGSEHATLRLRTRPPQLQSAELRLGPDPVTLVTQLIASIHVAREHK